MTTPEKCLNNNVNRTLTPVRLAVSPSVKSPTSDANFAVCKTRLAQIIKQLQDNFDNWQTAHKRGQAICTAIEIVKTRCIEAKPGDTSTLYPKELQQYCDKLAIITSIFEDVTMNTRELLRQLRALSKLPGVSNEIFYRSWQLSRFIAFVDQLENRYRQETVVKEYVMRELAHCKQRSSLIVCTTAWTYAQHVDAYVLLNFLLLAEEVKPS